MSIQSDFDMSLIEIDRIVISKASIDNPKNLELKSGVMEVTYTFNHAVSIDARFIRVVFICDLNARESEESTDKISGHFEIMFLFRMNELDHLISRESSGPPSIKRNLAVALANIAYSTSRGIIYTRCQGAGVGKPILPIVSNQTLSKMLS